MLPVVNKAVRQPIPVSELVLGVKCGGSDAFSGISANPSLGFAADLLVRSGGTVLITEVPEFCGAEHILAERAKDAATARAVYEMVDWYKDYAGKWGANLRREPQSGKHQGRSAQHYYQVAGRNRQGRHNSCGRRDRLRNASRWPRLIPDARSRVTIRNRRRAWWRRALPWLFSLRAAGRRSAMLSLRSSSWLRTMMCSAAWRVIWTFRQETSWMAKRRSLK